MSAEVSLPKKVIVSTTTSGSVNLENSVRMHANRGLEPKLVGNTQYIPGRPTDSQELNDWVLNNWPGTKSEKPRGDGSWDATAAWTQMKERQLQEDIHWMQLKQDQLEEEIQLINKEQEKRDWENRRRILEEEPLCKKTSEKSPGILTDSGGSKKENTTQETRKPGSRTDFRDLHAKREGTND